MLVRSTFLNCTVASVVMLVAAAAARSAAMPGDPNDSDVQIETAFSLASQHKYREAAAAIRGTQPPADKDLRLRYFRVFAAIHSGLGERREAALAMEQALALAPRDDQLAYSTALAEADAGLWNSCLRHVAPLFEKHGSPTEGLLLLRAQLAVHTEYAPTLAKLQSSTLTSDERAELSIRAGELLASAEKHREAAQQFEEALRISGTNDETLLYNLAVEEYSTGEYHNALDHIERAREQHDSAEIEDLAADIEEQSQDPVASLRSHQKAISLAPNDERYRLSLGAALLKYRSYAQAAEVFEKASSLFPNSSPVYAGLGMAYYLGEKYDESATALLRAVELEVGSEHALNYLGATQLDTDSEPLPKAIEAVCSRADSHPNDPVPVIWCGALLFRKAYLSGDRQSSNVAVARLQHAIELAPRDPVANCVLGRAYAWTENFSEARQRLEICVRLRPDSAQDHYSLSRVYSALGLKKAASSEAAQTAKLDSQSQRRDTLARQFTADLLSAPAERAQH
jgi:tetratricopeptide (TPR) repeat protein